MLKIKREQKIGRFAAGILIVLLTIIMMPMFIFASTDYTTQNLTMLKAGEVLDGPGFFGGNAVNVDGNVEGTTFAAGQSVTINGNINGDLFVAAQTVTVNGTVAGNIYGAGQQITVGGQNTGDAFLAGQNITIEKAAVLGRDLTAAGAVIVMNGIIKRDFSCSGSDFTINGSVGRNVALDAENVAIQEEAVIGGDFTYQSPKTAEIDAGAEITGQTDWKKVDTTPEKTVQKPAVTAGKALASLASLAAALLLWFVIRIWKPEIWTKTAEKISVQPVKTLGMGAIALIMTPILVILLLITVVGIPLGILLGIAYVVSLYLSKIIVAVFIGSWLSKRFGWKEIHKGVWLVLLGLVIVTILGMIPVLKILVWLMLLFAGLGAIAAVNMKNESREPFPEIPEKNG